MSAYASTAATIELCVCYLVECSYENQDNDYDDYDNVMGIIPNLFKLAQSSNSTIFIWFVQKFAIAI